MLENQAELEEVADKAAGIIAQGISGAGSEVALALADVASSLEHVAVALEHADASDAIQNVATVLDDNLRRIGHPA